MVSLYPRHWAVCRVEVDGADRLAYADKRRILLWDPVAGHTRVLAAAKGPTYALCAVRTRGRTLLASAGKGRAVTLWDPVDGELVARLTGYPAPRISALCTLPAEDGEELVVAAGSDGRVIVADPRTGRRGPPLAGGGRGVEDVCRVDVDGAARLASVGLDGTLRIWDPASGGCLHTLTGPAGVLRAVCAVDLDGRALVAAAGERFVIAVWDAVTGDLVRTLQPAPTPATLSVVSARGGTVFALSHVADDDGGRLAAGGDFPGIWLWDVRSGDGAGWIGWSGSPFDRAPECSWIRGLATYRHDGVPAIATAGYDTEVHSFPTRSTAIGTPFTGF